MTSQHAVGVAGADRARLPLDPLTADEIRQAVSILADDGRVTSPMRFVSVGLREPAKDEVASFGPGQAVVREACIVALDPREHMTYEALVSIKARSVLSWRPVPGARASITRAENAEFERLVRADSRFRAGLRRRGIHNPDQVVVEPWGIGTFSAEEDTGAGWSSTRTSSTPWASRSATSWSRPATLSRSRTRIRLSSGWRRWYAPAPAFVLQRLLFHADAEAVLQLVERCEAAAIEGLIPHAPERLPGRLVVAAQQACRLLHCLCFVLPGHRHLPFRWDR